MRKFEKTIKAGTQVRMVCGMHAEVKEVLERRQWVKLWDLEGCFKRSDIEKYTNQTDFHKILK
jgi:hypothetical protein